MIIWFIIISALLFSYVNVFGKKKWQRLITVVFAVFFLASLLLLVANDWRHFGMVQKISTDKLTLISSKANASTPVLYVTPLGNGKEGIYEYRTVTDRKKLQKTGTVNVTTIIKKNQSTAELEIRKKTWQYESTFYKFLFGVAKNDGQIVNETNTFLLPHEWAILDLTREKKFSTTK